MGLMDLEGMDVEDNTGGRPPKTEEDEEEEIEQYGVAFRYGDDCTEEWIQGIIDDILEDGLPDQENRSEFTLALQEISDYTNSSELVVRKHLDDLGMVDVDWFEYLAHRPHMCNNPMLPEEWYRANRGLGATSKDTIEILTGDREPAYEYINKPGESPVSKSSSSFLEDVEDSGTDSGLASIIKDEK